MTPAERLAEIKVFINIALDHGDTPRALRLIREQREIERQQRGGR
jgi:hypothetical protein